MNQTHTVYLCMAMTMQFIKMAFIADDLERTNFCRLLPFIQHLIDDLLEQIHFPFLKEKTSFCSPFESVANMVGEGKRQEN